MKIVTFEIRKVRLPMVRSFETAFGNIDHKETIITKLVTDTGLVGYGESSSLHAPLYNHETNDTCLYVQQTFIGPAILGKDIATPEEFITHYASVVDNPTAKTGPECAFWHIYAQQQNQSLKTLLGGNRTVVEVGESIGILGTVDQTLSEVDQALKSGYVRIKVKIKPGCDITIIDAVRQKYPDIVLSVDANSAYDIDKHRDVLKSLDQFNLSMIEQPFSADDFVDHATLQQAIETPICLDESIGDLEDMRVAVALGSCQVVNIKPGRVGGIIESMKIHDYAQKHDIGVWCGGMLETGIGRAYNLALASMDNFTYPVDMSPHSLFFTDDLVIRSLEINRNGTIVVPDMPGIGFEIDEAAIDRFTVEHVRLVA